MVNELVFTKIPFIVYELQASNEFKASSFWFHVTMMFHLLSLFNIVVGARLSFLWIIKNNAGKLIHRCGQAPAIYFHKRGRVLLRVNIIFSWNITKENGIKLILQCKARFGIKWCMHIRDSVSSSSMFFWVAELVALNCLSVLTFKM